MTDYWEAYSLRLKRNEKQLLDLVKEVQQENPTVEAYRHKSERRINSITFFKEDKICSIAFHEVPYRWSGCGFAEHGHPMNFGGENASMPFTAEDVLTNFKPLGKHNRYKDKESYLKWYSFLKLHISNNGN